MTGINHERVVATRDKGLAEDWNADHKQKGNHDCEQYQFLNQVLENRTSWPAGPVEGQIIYRSDYNSAFMWDGTKWTSLTPTATIVVAADGTGHTTDIQAGINMLPAGGGVVYIREGTYAITSKITINKNSVSIIGSGHSTIIRNSIDTTYLIEVAVGIDYCTIENIHFWCDALLGGLGAVISFLGATTRSRVSNCWFTDWEPRGIGFLGAGEGIIIENCIFESVTGAGPNYAILINDSSYCYLRGNFIYGGINVYGMQLITGTIHHVSILDNKIYNCVAPISIIGNGKNDIVGNTIAGFTYGMWIYGSSDNVISENFLEIGTIGIFLEENSDNNVMGNNRINNCDWGIVIDDVTEDKNIVVANGLVNNTAALVDNGTNTEAAHNTS